MTDRAVEQVLQRWQPAPADTSVVAVVGPPGSGRSALAASLTGLSPGVRVVDGPNPAASVVVLTFDASAPIGREELDLLAAAVASGAVVVCALTRIDAHRDWTATLDRDAALLAEHASGVTGPITPVSATTGDGLPELRTAIGAALASRSGPEGDRVRLERARATMLDAAADLRRDDATARLREQRTALIADRDGPRTRSSAALRRLTALARVDLTHHVGDRVRAAAADLRTEVDGAGRSALPQIPQRVRDEIGALTGDVDDVTGTVLAGLATEVLGSPHPIAGPNRPPPVVDPPGPRRRGVEDRMMIVVGASAGAGLGRLVVSPLTGIDALDVAALPVTLLIGAVAAWGLTRMRGLAADRAHMRQWIVETMAQVRSGLEQRVLTRLVDTEAEIGEAIGRAHRERAAATEPALTDVERALRETLARTSGRAAAVERDLAVLDRALMEPVDEVVRPSGQ